MSINERYISHFVDSCGWAGEREKYRVPGERIDRFVSLLGIDDGEKERFEGAVNRIFQNFCCSCEKYFARREMYGGKKVSTVLKERRDNILECSRNLAEALDDFDTEESDWLFSGHDELSIHSRRIQNEIRERLTYLSHLCETTTVQTSRGDADYMIRNALLELIAVVEDSTGEKVTRKHDYETEMDYGVFYDFARGFFKLVPEDLMDKVKGNKWNLEKAIRNALEEHNSMLLELAS